MNLTPLKAFELVKYYSGAIPSYELVRDFLNLGASEFLIQSEYLKNSFHTDSVAGKRYYTLPDSCYKIIDVEFNDVTLPRFIGDVGIDDDELAASGGNSLATPTASSNDRYWYTKNGRLGIIEKATNAVTRDGKTTNVQSCSVSGSKNIRIYQVSKGTPLADTDSQTSSTVAWFDEIPSEYQLAPVYRAVAEIYMMPNTVNTDMYDNFTDKFRSIVSDAKKAAKMQYRSSGMIKPCSF